MRVQSTYEGFFMTTAEAALGALCDWAAALPVSALPAPVLRRSAEILADDLAAALDASREPEPTRLRALLLARPRAEEATLFATGLPRTDRMSAAACNGTAAPWMELDGGFRPTPCHAGIYVWPALLAEAEATGASLDAALRAHALAYEIVTRVALAYRFATPRVHVHAAFSPLGAAAAVLLLRGVDAATLLSGIAGAATLASIGPRGHMVEGILARNAWVGAGAACGLLAADQAEAGIGGAPHSVAEVYAGVLGGTPDPARLTAGIGATWSVDGGYHKTFACCQHGHPTVDAILSILAERPVAPEQVAAIHVETHPLALSLDNATPATTLAGKFSLQHIAAATLVHRAGDARAFGAAGLADAAVGRLRPRVSMAPWSPLPAPPHDRPARVTLTLADGRRLVAECLSAPGNPDRPIGAAALTAKITAAAAGVLPGLATLPERAARDGARPWRQVLADLAVGSA
jgi:2-methylcitrate dehydratase PrpD